MKDSEVIIQKFPSEYSIDTFSLAGLRISNIVDNVCVKNYASEALAHPNSTLVIVTLLSSREILQSLKLFLPHFQEALVCQQHIPFLSLAVGIP
jgi:hypothetical protein